MSTTNYSGPATLVLDDGQEINIHVDLHTETDQELGIMSWYGVATCPVYEQATTLIYAVSALGKGRLRLASGEEADTLLETLVCVPGKDPSITVVGIGPAPYRQHAEEKDPMIGCPHKNFAVHAEVNRLTNTEDGPVTGYAVDIRVHCAGCQESFRWIGLDAGLSTDRPMCSVDQVELRAPIRPASPA